MAVVIKDMEMPKCCGECKVFDFVTYAFANGRYARCPLLLDKIKGDDLTKKRRDDCPLCEIVLPEELDELDGIIEKADAFEMNVEELVK